MTPQTPRSSRFQFLSLEDQIPSIDVDENFQDVVAKLSHYLIKAVDAAYSYEQLRTTVAGHSLRPLVLRLSEECHHPAIVAALLATRYSFNTSNHEDPHLTESRALACELVAFQFLTLLSGKELIDHLLYELPLPDESRNTSRRSASNAPSSSSHAHDTSPLLESFQHDLHHSPLQPPRTARAFNLSSTILLTRNAASNQNDLAQTMAGMNTLEIAAVANAKKFLSQKPVQIVVEDIWHGNIIFWESLSSHAKKTAKIYNERTADPFSRLRVPKYQKAFQILFFLAFLVLYYAVLVQRSPNAVTATEVLLYIWIAAFAYDEFGEFRDAGYLFYATDFWTIWDLMIIFTGVAFFVARVVGLVQDNSGVTGIAFDILSLLALFLVPRICSVASLNPYFGSLLPVLKEMTTTFCKFLPVICILYLGFLTTFTMLARDRLRLNEVSWLLIKVFFGSSYLGFDFAYQISPIFGYTLMVIFVALTNILLLTALVSLVSNSLTEVMAHAREEYLYQYSIYVLESCTSRRLTYFLPPTNLIPLLFIRPLRLCLPSDSVRQIRVMLLRTVSIPFVALIACYEGSCRLLRHNRKQSLAGIYSQPASSTKPLYGLPNVNESGMAPALRSTSPSACGPINVSASSSPSNSQGQAHIRQMIEQLSAQVDELTAMVAAQQSR